jgi:hypothetical protein
VKFPITLDSFKKFYDAYFQYRRTFEFVYTFQTKGLKRAYITHRTEQRIEKVLSQGERTLKKIYLKRIPDKVCIKILSNVTREEFKDDI